jgi:hydrogenase/urease accessory protein HupE
MKSSSPNLRNQPDEASADTSERVSGMNQAMRGAVIALILCSVPAITYAHESRPGYLEINEVEPGQYELFWKVPRRGDMRLSISPVLPVHCEDLLPLSRQATPGAFIERRTVSCGSEGLAGQTVSLSGLSTTITDVLVRVNSFDGESQTLLLKPENPSFTVAAAQPALEVAWAYTRLGIEHILSGIDHLLFVLGLMLLVNGIAQLVKTITAFTLAHSITLAMAALGYVNVPQAPIEAVIALSILFLATELANRDGRQPDLTERIPWVVALSFGLLHGFGFAGALNEVGLPESAIPLALFTFNVGVEIGQLMFVFVVLGLLWILQQSRVRWPAWSTQLPAYAIGSVAAFWCIQRVAGFW